MVLFWQVSVECRVSSVEFRGLELRAHAVVPPFPLFCSRFPKNKHAEEEEVEKREKKREKTLLLARSPPSSPSSRSHCFFGLSISRLSLSLAPQSRPSPSTAIHTHGISPRHRDRESARRRRTHAVAVAFFPISFTRQPALAFFSTDDDGDNDERPTAKRRKWTAVAAPSLASCISNAPCLVECIMRND